MTMNLTDVYFWKKFCVTLNLSDNLSVWSDFCRLFKISLFFCFILCFVLRRTGCPTIIGQLGQQFNAWVKVMLEA